MTQISKKGKIDKKFKTVWGRQRNPRMLRVTFCNNKRLDIKEVNTGRKWQHLAQRGWSHKKRKKIKWRRKYIKTDLTLNNPKPEKNTDKEAFVTWQAGGSAAQKHLGRLRWKTFGKGQTLKKYLAGDWINHLSVTVYCGLTSTKQISKPYDQLSHLVNWTLNS